MMRQNDGVGYRLGVWPWNRRPADSELLEPKCRSPRLLFGIGAVLGKPGAYYAMQRIRGARRSHQALCSVYSRRFVASLSESWAEAHTTDAAAEALVQEGVLTRGSREYRLFHGLSATRAEKVLYALRNRTDCVAVVLDGVHGVHNLAAVCRSCDAFGVQNVHFIPPDRYALHSETGSESETGPYATSATAKAHYLGQFLKSAACDTAGGAHKWLSLKTHGSVPELVSRLRALDYRIFVSSVYADRCISLYDLNFVDSRYQKCAFVFGNENSGVSEQLQEAADSLFTIPMYGFVESLNVSVSVATTLSYVTLQLRKQLGSDFPLPVARKREVLYFWLHGGSFGELERTATRGQASNVRGLFKEGRSAFSVFGRRFEQELRKKGLFGLEPSGPNAVLAPVTRQQYARRIQNYLIRRKGGVFGETDPLRRRRHHAETFIGLLAWMSICVRNVEFAHASSLLPVYRAVFSKVDEVMETDASAAAALRVAAQPWSILDDTGAKHCVKLVWEVLEAESATSGIDVAGLRTAVMKLNPRIVATRLLCDVLQIDMHTDLKATEWAAATFGPAAIEEMQSLPQTEWYHIQTAVRLLHACDVRRLFYLSCDSESVSRTDRKTFLHHPRHSLYECYFWDVMRSAGADAPAAGDCDTQNVPVLSFNSYAPDSMELTALANSSGASAEAHEELRPHLHLERAVQAIAFDFQRLRNV
jgi:tRNA (guanosine-2'-O-)-methyltransferase